MNELKQPFKNLKHRYKSLGFDGPRSYTTDRCCKKREFLYRCIELPDAPDLLAPGDDGYDKNGAKEMYHEIPVVTLPTAAKVTLNYRGAESFACKICSYLNE